MSKDKRTGWLADLQVGDTVIIQGRQRLTVATVQRITPSGGMEVDGLYYDAQGGGIRAHRGMNTLREASPELLARAKVHELQREARGAGETLLITLQTLDDLHRLHAVVEHLNAAIHATEN